MLLHAVFRRRLLYAEPYYFYLLMPTMRRIRYCAAVGTCSFIFSDAACQQYAAMPAAALRCHGRLFAA